MRVLLTTDGSKDATKAMLAACRLVTPVERTVDVLCVAPGISVPGSAKILSRAHGLRISAEVRRVLNDAKRTLAAEGVEALMLCDTGSPARLILKKSRDYDVTVIGAKGRNVRSEVGLGPVASRIVEHGTGCVLVGRELRGDKGIRILAPVDGSDGSQTALDALISFFDLESAEVKLMHVVETPWLGCDSDGELPTDSDPDEEKLAQQLRKEAERLVADAQTRILRSHPGVSVSIREGNPANEILSEADQGDYDLVVVGASGAEDMKHSMLGSVSSKVAWNASCSVLIVREPA
jgi:nucleotide-binding universal stress UspA family protein